jgi:hypothetical protein
MHFKNIALPVLFCLLLSACTEEKRTPKVVRVSHLLEDESQADRELWIEKIAPASGINSYSGYYVKHYADEYTEELFIALKDNSNPGAGWYNLYISSRGPLTYRSYETVNDQYKTDANSVYIDLHRDYYNTGNDMRVSTVGSTSADGVIYERLDDQYDLLIIDVVTQDKSGNFKANMSARFKLKRGDR